MLPIMLPPQRSHVHLIKVDPLQLWLVAGVLTLRCNQYPDAPCMEYLPTFESIIVVDILSMDGRPAMSCVLNFTHFQFL